MTQQKLDDQFLGGDFDELNDASQIKFQAICVAVDIQNPPVNENGEERFDSDGLRLSILWKALKDKKDGSQSKVQASWIKFSKVRNSIYGHWIKALRDSAVPGYDEAMRVLAERRAAGDREGCAEVFRGLLVGRAFEIEKTKIEFGKGINPAEGVMLPRKWLSEMPFDQMLVQYNVNVQYVAETFRDKERKVNFPIAAPKRRFSGAPSAKMGQEDTPATKKGSGPSRNSTSTGSGSAAPTTSAQEAPAAPAAPQIDALTAFLRAHVGDPTNGVQNGKIGAQLTMGQAVDAIAAAGHDAGAVMDVRAKAVADKWVKQNGPKTILLKDAP